MPLFKTIAQIRHKTRELFNTEKIPILPVTAFWKRTQCLFISENHLFIATVNDLIYSNILCITEAYITPLFVVWKFSSWKYAPERCHSNFNSGRTYEEILSDFLFCFVCFFFVL